MPPVQELPASMNDLAQIEDAAEVVRMAWDLLGYDPIPDLIDVLAASVNRLPILVPGLDLGFLLHHRTRACRGEVQSQNGRLFHLDLLVGTATAPPLFIRPLTA